MKARFAIAVAIPLGAVLACGTDAKVDSGGKDPASFGSADGGPGPVAGEDPTTCEEAAAARSYVGCDYWPTVTPNTMESIFDFAVAVANVGKTSADVTVTGPGGVNQKVSVAAGGLEKVYLPWVASLKGPDKLSTGAAGTVLAKASAYHVVSSRPVVVYQFNPLEFQAVGGPPGKDWSGCDPKGHPHCYSFSSDASLLLPSTAMTGNYRVMGIEGYSAHLQDSTGNPVLNEPIVDIQPSYFALTATQDGNDRQCKARRQRIDRRRRRHRGGVSGWHNGDSAQRRRRRPRHHEAGKRLRR